MLRDGYTLYASLVGSNNLKMNYVAQTWIYSTAFWSNATITLWPWPFVTLYYLREPQGFSLKNRSHVMYSSPLPQGMDMFQDFIYASPIRSCFNLEDNNAWVEFEVCKSSLKIQMSSHVCYMLVLPIVRINHCHALKKWHSTSLWDILLIIKSMNFDHI
jgi:hypothetical protein